MTPRPAHRSLAASLLSILFTALFTGLSSLPSAGQQMADPTTTLLLRELGAMTEMAEGGLRVVMAMPPEARTEAYRGVDIAQGDLVLAINGQRIRTLDAARGLYDGAAIGSEVALGIDRGGVKHIVRFAKADPAALPSRMEFQSGSGGHVMRRVMIGGGGGGGEMVPVQGLGVLLQDDAEAREVTVAMVLPDAQTSLQEGDRLVRCAGKEVGSAQQIADAVEPLDIGTPVALSVERDGKKVDLSVAKLEARGQLILRRNG